MPNRNSQSKRSIRLLKAPSAQSSGGSPAIGRKPVKTSGAPRIVAYARVSTDAQTSALQTGALKSAGVDVLFKETASGANPARPVLAKALASLRPGDTLVVWRLDRLGRSLSHLVEITTLLRERRVYLRSLSEGFDTSKAAGRLLYQVLGAVAAFEREVVRERTVAGMKAAKKRGTHIGRPSALSVERLAQAKRMLEDGTSQVEVARVLRVSRATIQRAYSLPDRHR